MKDEEMADKYAEEYVMREDIITENDRVPFDNGYGYQTVSFEEEVKKGYKDGFLAGLKARLQWHDLRKDPNDLPKKTDGYLVYRISGYGIKSTELIQYNSERHFWCVEHQNDVIKWCEIPTFEKE